MNETRIGRIVWAMFPLLLAAAGTFGAFPEVPWDSAKALQVTKGRPFSSGAVFINGKYIEPPYVVERWGTGLRINGKPISGQVIDWNDFLRTQSGAKANHVEVAAPEAAAAAPAPAEESTTSSEETSLDDLFDDNPKPKKPAAAPARKPVARPRAATVTYTLEGEFVPNDVSRKMLARINAERTEIDRILRSGGFFCFGDRYSRVFGDERTLLAMLETLPEMQQSAESSEGFRTSVRAARMAYINDILAGELYRNRIDYRKLKALRSRIKKDNELKRVLNGSQLTF